MNLKTEKVKKEWTEDYLSKLRKRLNCSHERKASKHLPFEIDLSRVYDIKTLGNIYLILKKVVLREINKVFGYISEVIKCFEVNRGFKGALSSVG
jgi:hypothetical protein